MADDIIYRYNGQVYSNIPIPDIAVNRMQETADNPKPSRFLIECENTTDRLIKEIRPSSNLPATFIDGAGRQRPVYKIGMCPEKLEPHQISEIELTLYGSSLLDLPSSQFPEHVYLKLDYTKELRVE